MKKEEYKRIIFWMSFIDSDWYPLQAALILFFGSKVTRMQKLIPIENFHYAIVTTSIEGVGVPYARTDLGTCNILFFLLGFSRPNRDRITAGRNRIILSRSFSILIKIVLFCQRKATIIRERSVIHLILNINVTFKNIHNNKKVSMWVINKIF